MDELTTLPLEKSVHKFAKRASKKLSINIMEGLPKHIVFLSFLLSQISSHLCAVNPLNSDSIQVLNSIVSPLSGIKPPPKSSNAPSIDLQHQMMAQQPYYPQQPPQIINIGSQTPLTTPCAIISTTSNCVLTVPDDGIHNDIQSRNFVLANAIIRQQCSLTVKDCVGSYTTSTHYLLPQTFGCTYAASVCCECYGCGRSNLPLYANSCGILFENDRCSYCNGFRLEVAVGDSVARMNPLVSKKISSMFVLPGCKMTVFTEPDFRGFGAEATGPIDNLPPGWNDAISSYTCSCFSGEDGDKTTTNPPLPEFSTFVPIASTTAKVTETSTFTTPEQTQTTTEKLISTTTESTTQPITFPPSTSTEPPPLITTTTNEPEPMPTTDQWQIY